MKWIALALAVTIPGSAAAGSGVRYALIVGSNRGNTSEADLTPLRHAEREAAELKNRLVHYANFDEQRVELVIGGGREQVLAAARRLAERRRADVAQIGPLPSLFAVFFSGHGLSGKMLTRDDPLTGKDIAGLVREMDATLTIGFFDACSAGGFDFESLRHKGILPTPGFNPVAELPREVLDSEGTMWFVSSRPDEQSYEDDQLGGLFTHFFSESFTHAGRDAGGVTLETMWEYARRRTASWAASHGRQQTPEKIVRDLKTHAPLYFSFPQERRARLRFGPLVAGTFLLLYEQSALVERIEKQPGRELEIATYEGTATLRRVDGPATRGASKQVTLEAGSTLLIQQLDAAPFAHAPGYADSSIHGKGSIEGLAITERRAQISLLAGATYRWVPVPSDRVGTEHVGGIALGLARGPLGLSLDLGYGRATRRYSEWSYALNQLEVRLGASVGLDLGGPRLELEIDGGTRRGHLAYGDGEKRNAWGGEVGMGARLLWPMPMRSPWLVLEARAGVEASWAEGVGSGDSRLRGAIAPVLGAGIAVPFELGRSARSD